MKCFTLLILIVIGTLISGCNKADKTAAQGKTEPAHVEHHVEESHLNRVTLTERAVERLGIKLASVEKRAVRRKQTFGGEVILPPGKSIVVSAPIAGTLAAPANQTPQPGSHVEAKRPIFAFTPLLTPERDVLTPSERVRMAQTRANVATAQIEAERQVESAKVTVKAAQIAYERAAALFQSKAGSQRIVDEAQANLDLAQEALTTAEARHQFLRQIKLDEEAGKVESRNIESPVAGVLQTLDATAGETVGAGETLFTIITTSRVWIRVPIYAGRWGQVDTSVPSQISELGEPTGAETQEASYVSAPPSANAMASTVDVFYEIDNAEGKLYPGQRLAVTVPLKGEAESLVVPFAAVLYDIHGGAWVYQQLKERVYARQRVAVEYVDGDVAVLREGPEPGARVVTDGAAELFGTEFGVGH